MKLLGSVNGAVLAKTDEGWKTPVELDPDSAAWCKSDDYREMVKFLDSLSIPPATKMVVIGDKNWDMAIYEVTDPDELANEFSETFAWDGDVVTDIEGNDAYEVMMRDGFVSFDEACVIYGSLEMLRKIYSRIIGDGEMENVGGL